MTHRLRPRAQSMALAMAFGLGISTAAHAGPPDLGVAVALVYDIDHLGSGPVVTLRTGEGFDLYRNGGELPHSDRISATLSTEFHVTPLLYGDLARVFQQTRIRAGFTDSTTYTPRLGYSDPTFSLNNGAEILLELNSLTPRFRAYSELVVDPGLPALPHLSFEFPLLQYQYQAPTGLELRQLDLGLRLLPDPTRCSPTECTFDRGEWNVTLSAVPEPGTAATLAAGLAAVLALRRQRAQPFRRRAA